MRGLSRTLIGAAAIAFALLLSVSIRTALSGSKEIDNPLTSTSPLTEESRPSGTGTAITQAQGDHGELEH